MSSLFWQYFSQWFQNCLLAKFASQCSRDVTDNWENVIYKSLFLMLFIETTRKLFEVVARRKCCVLKLTYLLCCLFCTLKKWNYKCVKAFMVYTLRLYCADNNSPKHEQLVWYCSTITLLFSRSQFWNSFNKNYSVRVANDNFHLGLESSYQ